MAETRACVTCIVKTAAGERKKHLAALKVGSAEFAEDKTLCGRWWAAVWRYIPFDAKRDCQQCKRIQEEMA